MRKFTLDNKAIPCPNVMARTVLTRGAAKRGDMIQFRVWSVGPLMLGRVMGRIATCDDDGENCIGYACVMVLSECAETCYIRWVNPFHIYRVMDVPTKVPAFFFKPTLPDNATLIREMERGSISERFIDQQGVL